MSSLSSSSSHTTSESGDSSNGYPEEDLRIGQNSPGYFPARLGQPLGSKNDNQRYCVSRKLGWGQFSSVWLARDRKENRFVALKILTHECTKALQASDTDKRSDEIAMLQKICSVDRSHRGFVHTLELYDSFSFDGPQGNHVCLVTEPLSFSLAEIRTEIGELQGDMSLTMILTKRIIKHILYALEYLHDVCGIIHGDIKHDNILCRPTDLDAVITQALIQYPSISYTCDTRATPSIVPIISQPLPPSAELTIPSLETTFVLSDFGHSHWQKHHFQEIIQPNALRAPEVILGYPWAASADIWNLGCLVAELLTGFWLFKYRATEGWTWEEDLLARMTEATGCEFDPAFLAKCQHSRKFFKEDGEYKLPIQSV
ncbi:hypothetical protein VKT23_010488 [Stygiomarasmius scandens]|uniref:non-specific serine/threonine protein kinase n=1 Tax=Marasmiellus scandens TaxID=2682957 RepID=A0ABR1JGI6_9AGAR